MQAPSEVDDHPVAYTLRQAGVSEQVKCSASARTQPTLLQQSSHHNMGKKKSKKSKNRTPKMDKIDQFFADYPDFDYDRTESSPREFYRMCDFFDWGKNSRDEYPAERLQAQDDFRRAMVENFNDHFGTDVDDQQAWEHMCVVLGIEPLPQTMQAMKAVCFVDCHA